jgi:hypothetical protein
MTQSGKSLFFFGIYVVCTGLLFVIIPENITSLMMLPPVPSGWARFIGLLALVIGSYDIYAGQANIKPLIKISVLIRLGFASGSILLYVFGQMPISIILLGGVDALGAVWTTMALKSEKSIA